MRAPARFENDVMRMCSVVIGAALASILAGVAAFVIGLREPVETHVGMATPAPLHDR